MPFYKKDNRTIHFIHIPKTGGMSVRSLLEANGWVWVSLPKFFDDGRKIDGHIPRSYWQDLEISKHVDYEFTIVRDPIRRTMSHINMTLGHTFDVAKKEMEDHAFSQEHQPNIRQTIKMMEIFPAPYTENADSQDRDWET